MRTHVGRRPPQVHKPARLAIPEVVRPSPDPRASGSRIAELDGLRGLAALAVLVFHAWLYTLPTPDAGADTVEVLRGLGYSEAELTDMKARGIV